MPNVFTLKNTINLFITFQNQEFLNFYIVFYNYINIFINILAFILCNVLLTCFKTNPKI